MTETSEVLKDLRVYEEERKENDETMAKENTSKTVKDDGNITRAKKVHVKKSNKSDEAPSVSPSASTKRDKVEDRRFVLEFLEEKLKRTSPTSSEQQEDVCYPVLIHFLSNLSDEQWTLLRLFTRDPASKTKLYKMCQKIVNVISETVFRILLPAILLLIEPEQVEDISSDSHVTLNREPARYALKTREEWIREYNYSVREARKPGSGIHYYSRSKSSASSKSSQGSVKKTPIQDLLKTLFSMTEDSVMESLTGRSSSQSPELTRAVVGEVIHQLNAAISVIVAHSPSGSSSPVPRCFPRIQQATKQMVQGIHNGLQKFGITKKIVPTPAEAEKDLEMLLAPMTGELMTAMANSMGSVQTSATSSTVLLQELVDKIRVLTSRSSNSVVSSTKNLPSETEKAGIDTMVLSSPDFMRNSSTAVREVLKRQASSSDSLCGSMTTSQIDLVSFIPPPDFLPLAQAESAASVIIQSFVQDIEAVAEGLKSENDSIPRSAESTRNTVLTEALEICKQMQARLKNVFKQPAFQRAERKNMAAAPEGPHQEQSAVDMQTRQETEDLEPCTKEVLSLVLAAFKSKDVEAECSPAVSEQVPHTTSLPLTLFMDQLISQLDAMTTSSCSLTSHGPESDDSLQERISGKNEMESSSAQNLTIMKKLSSDSFLTKAKEWVTDILMKTESCVFSTPSSPATPSHETNTPETDVDAEASKIIEVFVSNVKETVQTIISSDNQRLADADQAIVSVSDATQNSDRDSASGQPCGQEKMFSATMRLYQDIQGKLSEYFRWGSVTEQSDTTSSQEGELVQNVIDEDGTQSKTKLEDTTNEVISEIVTTYRTELAKSKSSPSMLSRSSDESLYAEFLVNAVIAELQGLTCSRSPSPEEVTPGGTCASSRAPSCAGSLRSLPLSNSKLISSLSLPMESLTSAKFYSKATSAVSEVLLRSFSEFNTHSYQVFPTESALTSLNVVVEAEDMVNTFVSEVKSISESAGSSVLNCESSFPVALCLVKRLQTKLKAFYSQLLAQRNTKAMEEPQRDEHQKQADCHGSAQTHLSPRVSMSQPVLAGIRSLEDVILPRSQSESSRPMVSLTTPEVSQALLDFTTKEVLRKIVGLHKSEVFQGSVSQDKSDESLAAVEFVEQIMMCLEDITSPSRSTLSLCVDPEVIMQDMSCVKFHSEAATRVKGVLVKCMNCIITGSSHHSPSAIESGSCHSQDSTTTIINATRLDSAAVDIFDTIVSSIKGIFHTSNPTAIARPTDNFRASEASLQPALSIEETVSEVSMWSAAHIIQQRVQKKLRDFISLTKQSSTETRGATLDEARKSLSQILVTVTKELSRSEEMQTSEDVSQLHVVLRAMLDHLETVESEDVRPRTSVSAVSLSSAKALRTEKYWQDVAFSLPGTPIPQEIPVNISPIVRSTMINTTDDPEPNVSLDHKRQTMLDVMGIIKHHVDPLVLRQSSTPGAAFQQLEELTSQGRIKDLSRDLVDRLENEMSENGGVPLTGTVVAGKSVSDSVMSSWWNRNGEGASKAFTLELVNNFAEESVKRLLLPLLLPPPSCKPIQEDPQCVTHFSPRRPSASSSSGGSVGSTGSPCVYDDTVSLFTKIMVHQVTDTLSMSSDGSCSPSLTDTGICDKPSESGVGKKGKGIFKFLQRLKFMSNTDPKKKTQTLEASKNQANIKTSTEGQPFVLVQQAMEGSLPSSSQPEEKPTKRSPLVRMFSSITKCLGKPCKTSYNKKKL